jgi:serine/threonine-protein kinase
MGEVYRATDTRLGREVALKLLPEAFASDPDRLARFEREAKLLASLSHPNIAVLHALEEAHEHGIVHRDLKPANVKVTADGRVKVLDFGLAKAWGGEGVPGSAPDLSQSSTLAHTGTAAGVILGTAAYMSPEQARGRAVDKRSDVWSFGALLHEMLTGRPLFGGETVSDLLAAVLTREPDWPALPAATPLGVRRLLRRCLERDPKRRLRDIGEARIALASPLGEEAVPAPARRAGVRAYWPWAALAAAAAAVFVLLGRWRAPSGSGDTASLRLSIPLAANQQVSTLDNGGVIAFSPDGKSVVMSILEDGEPKLYRRRLDEATGRTIEGTEGGTEPFFSPDGRWLGFISGGKLVRVPADGGRPLVLGDQRGAGGATWGADGRILYAPIYSDGLFRIPAEGGEPQRLTTPDRAKDELGHWWPQILPGGKAALFTAFRSPVDTSRVGVVSLETGEVRYLVEGGIFGRYAQSGHLLYARGNHLFAAPFDPRSASVTGTARMVLDDVHTTPTAGSALFDVSSDGTLAWVPASVADAVRELVFVDRDGRTQPAIAEKRRYRGVSLSPDGRSLATAILGESEDIWSYSLERGTLSRVTTGPRTDFSPLWSPDGRSLFYVLDRPPYEIQRLAPGAAGDGEPLFGEPAELDTVITDVSPDGRFVVFTLSTLETGTDLWARDVEGKAPARPLRATRAEEDYASVSPDGRYVAYESNETGRSEIYVEAFPTTGERSQISADGGTEPVWAQGSDEIFYRHGDEMRVVRTRTSASFAFEPARTLFQLSFQRADNGRTYDVARDGRRLVVVRSPDATAPRRVDLVTRWLDELERGAAAGGAAPR